MPVARVVITQIRDQDDANITPSSVNDGDAVVYNYAADKFILSDVSITVDTRRNILSSSPGKNKIALSSDTFELFIWNGTNWRVAPLELNTVSSAPDIGLQPPMVQNDLSGYSNEYITDKLIANCRIGSSSINSEGSFRVNNGKLQIYLNSTWNDIVLGFRFRENSNENYELEHKPIGFEWWYEVATGNSDKTAINGLPLVMGYEADMGAYPTHPQIIGRSF